MEEILFTKYTVGLQEIKTSPGFPAALHRPYHITCCKGNGQSVRMVMPTQLNPLPNIPYCFPVIPCGQHQEGKSVALFSGWPQHHMPQNSIDCVSNEATGIHITTAVLRHCGRSQKNLPKLGSCRAGRDPLNVVFII